MKRQKIQIHGIPAIIFGDTSSKLCLYIHGQGGHKEEAEILSNIACQNGWQVLSIDLPEHGDRADERNSFNPWHVVPELIMVMKYIKQNWKQTALIANSIGAWFSMLSFKDEPLKICWFISPVLDMTKLISKMMSWASVSEEQLKQKRVISTSFGQELSWEYWEYALSHPILKWNVPTKILYGEYDNLIDREIVEDFSQTHRCHLTIAEKGEHWFHTEQQLKIMCQWFERELACKKRAEQER